MKKGTWVIVRSYAAGVHFGKLVSETITPNGKTTVLDHSRRLWYWSGAASLSQLAVDGTSNPSGCKFPVAIPKGHQIERVEETIPVSKKAMDSINSVPIWKA
jgi:hypothetical protein